MTASVALAQVTILDPGGAEFASESWDNSPMAITLNAPIAYRTRGQSEYQVLAGVVQLILPMTNVQKIIFSDGTV